MSKYLGSTLVAGVGRNTERNANTLLSFKWSDHIINSMEWLRADTFSWQAGSVYQAAYNHLVADLIDATASVETIGTHSITVYTATDGHKIVLDDMESEVAAIFAATGIAWYYIVDTTNTRFKLPRTKFGFTGLRDTVGKYIPETLPNATGRTNSTYLRTNATSQAEVVSGGMTGTYNSSDTTYGLTGNKTLRNLGFDLSLSSSTYQNGAPVQQRATQMYLYFYVGQYTQSATEQTAGLNAELFNGKADIDLDNISTTGKATVVGWGVPDYSAGIGFSNNTNYTAPSDGFVIASGHTSTSVSSYFDLNGTRMANFVSSTTIWLPALVYCPVHKGDVIKINFTQSTFTMKFYPLKGV